MRVLILLLSGVCGASVSDRAFGRRQGVVAQLGQSAHYISNATRLAVLKKLAVFRSRKAIGVQQVVSREIMLGGNVRVNVTPSSQRAHTIDGQDFWDLADGTAWEVSTFRAFDAFIKPSDVVMDFGSWIGPTVLYAAALAKQVWSLEPDPFANVELQTNIALNPQLSEKILVSNACISHDARTLTMSGTGGNSGSTLTYSHYGGKIWSVDCLRLADFIEINDFVPDFVKIDTEGSEFDIVPTMETLIQSRAPTLWLTLHQNFFKNGNRRPLMRVLKHYKHVYTDTGKRVTDFESDPQRSLKAGVILLCTNANPSNWLSSFDKPHL